MNTDLDRYYTPENVAVDILESANISLTPKVFADSTCGSGRLLDAAITVFGSVECIGLDRDKDAINQLRKTRPNWHLAVANLLGRKDYIKRFSRSLPNPVDMLLLNPPFSHGNRKSTNIRYNNKDIKATVSMAHLLRSLEIFNPIHGAIAIVPESLLHSQADEDSRNALQNSYLIENIANLKSCTFRGARVNSSVIQLSRGANLTPSHAEISGGGQTSATLVRGSLPVHLMKSEIIGTPFLHSTHIRRLASGESLDSLPATNSQAKGRVDGWAILLPRVGLPDNRALTVVNLPKTVQLSDCVIALIFNNESSAEIAKKIILENWLTLRELYKGTGARYVTISRLLEWLTLRGITAKPL
ncbi:N-6 DNA methylase [Pseudomonas aeruginosa]|uniref:N-6 DNA methylase n=1 Tax=Pseudomonas aeruginosa TaxID=287 RepID=UPI000D659795|nr:N-6 DNA methylase [Pseudomonas aeruginosa]MBX5648224.1 N-6 DNA methylase [Pseudomonas aeruginosa]MCV0030024.1 N-6 DNA methylase [Pseudomonas aeruginosa]MCY0414815.1 N-6 DNA methylase [Pseudomonas aeruginosa]MCY0430644.1 N-6 DNA methylase [Pseudomonas aeruginosa]MDH7539496.1 N-6 DNA methylase [Pseudomonas aeruginosa]